MKYLGRRMLLPICHKIILKQQIILVDVISIE